MSMCERKEFTARSKNGAELGRGTRSQTAESEPVPGRLGQGPQASVITTWKTARRVMGAPSPAEAWGCLSVLQRPLSVRWGLVIRRVSLPTESMPESQIAELLHFFVYHGENPLLMHDNKYHNSCTYAELIACDLFCTH